MNIIIKIGTEYSEYFTVKIDSSLPLRSLKDRTAEFVSKLMDDEYQLELSTRKTIES